MTLFQESYQQYKNIKPFDVNDKINHRELCIVFYRFFNI